MDKFSELKAAAFSLKNMSDRKAKGLRTSTLQINAAAAKMRGMLTADAVLALLAELAEKDKRIAELEAKLAAPAAPEKCPCCNRRYTLESYAHGECAICGEAFDAAHALRSMGFKV